MTQLHFLKIVYGVYFQISVFILKMNNKPYNVYSVVKVFAPLLISLFLAYQLGFSDFSL